MSSNTHHPSGLLRPEHNKTRRFLDRIHHRAQLGDYRRTLNIPLPATFEPSADEAPIQ